MEDSFITRLSRARDLTFFELCAWTHEGIPYAKNDIRIKDNIDKVFKIRQMIEEVIVSEIGSYNEKGV